MPRIARIQILDVETHPDGTERATVAFTADANPASLSVELSESLDYEDLGWVTRPVRSMIKKLELSAEIDVGQARLAPLERLINAGEV